MRRPILSCGKIFGLIFMLFCLSPISAVAKSFQVLPVKSVATPKTQVDSFRELVVMAINDIKGAHVTDNADTKIQLHIVKVGSGFKLSGERIEANNKEISISIRVNSEDELDTGANRIAQGLVSGRSEDAESGINDVTEHESKSGTIRKKTNNRFYLGIGPSVAHGLGLEGKPLLEYNLGFTFEREQLAPKIFIDGVQAVGSSPFKETHFGIGIDYYLNKKDFSPLIGCDLAYGGVHSEVKDESGTNRVVEGFSIGLEGGYAIMRTSGISLSALITWRPVLEMIEGNVAGVTGFQLRLSF